MAQKSFGFGKSPKRKEKIGRQFREFCAANPEVYELFKQFTFQAIQRGRARYSADAVFHRIRWHVDIETRSADDFKLNDHYTACYARKFMRDFPEHDGFFETRKSAADEDVEGDE